MIRHLGWSHNAIEAKGFEKFPGCAVIVGNVEGWSKRSVEPFERRQHDAVA
jgi:hypothetical protein